MNKQMFNEEIEMTTKTIKFTRTKFGIPSLWEKTKLFTDMKRISIVLSPDGISKKPLKIKQDAKLITLSEGDLIIKLFFDNDGNGISILRIINIDKYSNNAEVEVLLRKPSTSNTWIKNKDSVLLNKIVLDNILLIIDEIIKNEK